MKRPLIYLAFTDDWELRGDGSGDMDLIQVQPMGRLLAIFQKYGVKSTFMVELMQQLTFRREQERISGLKSLADKWDLSVIDAFKLGHDIQPHIHPQWSDARFENEAWSLDGDWSILNYKPDAAERMILDCKKYLEDLLRPISPDYTCIAFRSGSSVIAPSPFILGLLAKHGFIFDLSIVGGLSVNTRKVKYDYTVCDEDFLPFYPRMDDARHISDKPEPIVCVPIFHFYGSRRRVIGQIATAVTSKIKSRFSKTLSGADQSKGPNDDWSEIGRTSLPARVYDKVISPIAYGKHMTADTGRLSLPFLREMMSKIRKRAESTGLGQVPVILTNHTKYMTDFDSFDTFLRETTAAHDVRIITLTTLSKMLAAGEFHIQKADA